MSMISNKKKAYIGLIALFIIIFGVLGFIITQTKSDKIMKNVYIDNINIGDMSKEESKEILEKQYQLKIRISKNLRKAANFKINT